MASLADLVVTITAQTKQFDKAIKDVKKQTSEVESGFKGTTKAIKSLVSGVAVAALVAKIASVTSELIDAASEAEETQAKFDTAFRGIEDVATETAEELARVYGLSSTESKRLLGDTGDLLKGFGATATEALNFSNEIQKLSVDLASYNNVQGGASRVSNILTKSVLGNKDGLSELGVSLLDVDIKQELVRTGQDKLTGQAGKLAKAQATFNLILQQTGDAQGDAIRTQDSYANVSRRAEAAVKDLRVELGRALLPTATTVKSIFGDLVGELGNYIRKINDLRDAEKALEAGEATFDQRILLLEEQKKGIDETLKTQRAFAEAEKRQYGDVNPLVQQRLRQLEAQSAGIGRNIDNLRLQQKEEIQLNEEKLKAEEIENKRRAAEEDAERVRQENFKASLKLIDDVISASKSKIEVIDQEIQALENLETTSKDQDERRLEAIRLLKEEKGVIIDEEIAEEREKREKAYQERQQAVIDSNNAIYEIEKETQERIRAERQQTLSTSIDIANTLVAIAGNLGEREIQTLQATADARIQALDESVLGAEEYSRQKEEIEKELARKEYDIKLAQFRTEQALAIITAGINTAVAVTANLAVPPLAAAIGIAGAAQIALIASQPEPPAPQLATGAFIEGSARGTNVIVGEGGNDEEIFGMGSRGVPRRQRFASEVADMVMSRQNAGNVYNFNSLVNVSDPQQLRQFAQVYEPFAEEFREGRQ